MTEADRVTQILATVPERLARSQSPGAAVAVHAKGMLQEIAAGIADIDARTPVTTRTLFGMWSVAKVVTASVFAVLAAAGKIDLDAPACRYLPELAACGDDRGHITITQLLCHTSGIDGGAFVDLGDGDDCRQRYVYGLARVTQLFAPGSAYGYSNAGYIVLGALAERVTDMTWEDLVQATILSPGGLSQTTARGRSGAPGQVTGAHLPDENGRLRTAVAQYPTWRSCAPCGSTSYATAGDLARFGALHLPGTRLSALLADSPPSAGRTKAVGLDVLQRPVIPIPGYEYEARTSCLGWNSRWWSGVLVLAHDGGAHTFLRVFPGAGMSIAVMVNGPGGPEFAEPLIADLSRAVTGIRPPQPPASADSPPDLDLGRYGSPVRRHLRAAAGAR
jgi:CubicO group peptidase (beta-lactamase class C family)